MENVMYVRLGVLVTNICFRRLQSADTQDVCIGRRTLAGNDTHLYSRGWGRLFLLGCSLLEEFAFFLEKLVDLLRFLGTTA